MLSLAASALYTDTKTRHAGIAFATDVLSVALHGTAWHCLALHGTAHMRCTSARFGLPMWIGPEVGP